MKMKKPLLTILTLLLMLCFTSGCVFPGAPTQSTQAPTAAATTVATTVAETEAVTEPSETQPTATQPVTQPEHSALYIPDVSVEDVITYFNEVCLDSEFVNGGDPSVVQKWMIPIRYKLHGAYTQEDLAVLNSFVTWLNQLEGFPGIAEAQPQETVNLNIHFCPGDEFPQRMGENYAGLDGGVLFWYDDNEIYDATICYRTDLEQYTRNSVILEEIYNGLGPVQDTVLRPDSLIFQQFTVPQWMSAEDELILKLLYHPGILPGMDAFQCQQVIRELYY